MNHNQDIFTGHKLSLCPILASDHFPLQVMAQIGIKDFLIQWPGICKTDPVTILWHTLGSLAVFTWNRKFLCLWIRTVRSRHTLLPFYSNDLKHAQMGVGLGHDRSLGQKQFLCCHFQCLSIKMYRLDTDIALFLQWHWPCSNDQVMLHPQVISNDFLWSNNFHFFSISI